MTRPAENNERTVSLKPFLGAVKSRRVFARSDLRWDGLKLRLGRGRVVGTVVPDAKWPGMWRVSCGGKLSDMANLTRAKDAAKSIALAELNGAGGDE
jgi:hypothetical protein